MMPNQYFMSLESHVVVYSRLTLCQVPPELFKDHPCKHSWTLDRGMSKKQIGNFLATLHTCAVGLFSYICSYQMVMKSAF